MFSIPPKIYLYLYLYCCNNIIRAARVISCFFFLTGLFTVYALATQSSSRSRVLTYIHKHTPRYIKRSRVYPKVLSVFTIAKYACFSFDSCLLFFSIRIMINVCEYATMIEIERREARGREVERVNEWKIPIIEKWFCSFLSHKIHVDGHINANIVCLVHTKLDVAIRSCIYFSGILYECSSSLKNRLDSSPHVPPIRRLRINIVSANIIKYRKYRE